MKHKNHLVGSFDGIKWRCLSVRTGYCLHQFDWKLKRCRTIRNSAAPTHKKAKTIVKNVLFKYLSLIALDCFHKFRFNCLLLMKKRTFQHRVQFNCLQLIIHCISKIPTNYKQWIFQSIATTASCANVLIWISIEKFSIHWKTNTQELIFKKWIHFKLLPTKMLEFPMENAWIWFSLQIKI